jgi:hypothetical protein
MNPRILPFAAALVAVIGIGACDKQLTVDNPNAGNTGKVIGNPLDAEALLGSYYKRWHDGLWSRDNPPANFEGMANQMSLMNYSSLANNCQNARTPFSGATNVNTPGNTCQGEQQRLYFYMSEVNRVASNILAKLDSGMTIGISTPATDARNLRARSFGEFLRGISLGYLALFYDSAGITSPTMDKSAEECVPDPLSGVCVGKLKVYTVVMDSAYAAFARAIDYANRPTTGSDGFPLPTAWIPSSQSYTAAEFVKLIRSYRARFRANIARTPAERAAADWAAIIDDAQHGITVDHLNTTNSTTGPGAGWRRRYESYGLWHQMPPFYIGMSDTSGSYAAWIAQPMGDRGAGNVGFLTVTPDLRFPQGTTRAQQQADFAISSCQSASTRCKRYFVNRASGGDQFAGNGFGQSNYDFVRNHSWRVSGDGTALNGDLVFFPKAEVDLLQAEGQFRLGNYAAAAALINKTRARGMDTVSKADPTATPPKPAVLVAAGGGLDSITVFDATTPVPGGNHCVPKVPVGNFTTVACGTMWDALKYEKRIETAYITFAPWFLDGRGWGELPRGTPLYWATPYQDLQARGKAIADLYGTGIGPGNAANSAAGASVYGW